jgi:hypothetical protein
MGMRTATLLVAFVALAVPACAHEKAEDVSTARVTSATVNRPQARRGRETHMMAVRTEPKSWAPLEEWRSRYPAAAQNLDEWREAYPRAATRLSRWDAHHSEKLEVLIDWAITHRYEPLGSFFLTRSSPGWDELSSIARDEHEGVEAFLQWARESSRAAEEMALHHRGLARTRLGPPSDEAP